MTDVLLVSEKTLKSEGLVCDNVDGMYLAPTIQFAQDAGLQPILGTNLYRRLKELVASGEIEGTQYQELLDVYVTPYLVNKVMANLPIPLIFKIRNAGVVSNYDTNIQQTSLNDAQYLIHYWDNRSAFYANRLEDYLCSSCGHFPEYHTKSSCSDMTPSHNVNTIIHFRK